MDILDRCEKYLSIELNELIIRTLYSKYIENVKKNKEKKFMEGVRLIMSNRYSSVYKKSNIYQYKKN